MRITVCQGLLVIVLCSVADFARPDDGTGTGTTSSQPKRMSRKYYDAEIYSGAEIGDTFAGQGPPRFVVGKRISPYRHTGSGVLKKSGSSNWNVWRGNENDDDDNDDGSNEDDRSGWQQPSPPQGWDNGEGGNPAWMADPMTILLLKNAMAEIKGEKKPEGFLAKLKSDPALLLVAASIPISLLLAAVLPTYLNYAMGTNNIPTVSTTATGNKSRSSKMDLTPYLKPIMEAVGDFGARSISNPDCMQRIFCQVALDKMGKKGSKHIKKAASVAKFLTDGSWLESLGVKDLVSSLASGSCENVPCSKYISKKEPGKLGSHRQKLHLNSVKK